jgi:hypothetical protein
MTGYIQGDVVCLHKRHFGNGTAPLQQDHCKKTTTPTSATPLPIFPQSLHHLAIAMKRALASLNPDELADDSVHTFKRWKPHNTDESSHNFGRAFKRRRSYTPPLTQETLGKLHCTTEPKSLEGWAADCAQSVQRWAN